MQYSIVAYVILYGVDVEVEPFFNYRSYLSLTKKDALYTVKRNSGLL